MYFLSYSSPYSTSSCIILCYSWQTYIYFNLSKILKGIQKQKLLLLKLSKYIMFHEKECEEIYKTKIDDFKN